MSRTVTGQPPRVVVLGDLVADVVLQPAAPLRRGTDVAGRVVIRQGGSAATTARVLASLGVSTALVTALGIDGAGDGLEAYMRGCGVDVHAVRARALLTGRLGVVVEPDAERSFVADRGAILGLRPRHLRAAWFRGADVLHLPAYSLLDDGLGSAGERAAELARSGGASVTVDLSSSGFLEDAGVTAVLDRIRRIGAAVVFLNEAERRTVDGRSLLELAPIVVLKQGRAGATAFGPTFERHVLARAADVDDSTGAGDAFDAGFLAAWLTGGRSGRPEDLEAAIRAGHRAARREVTGRRLELSLSLRAERATRRSAR